MKRGDIVGIVGFPGLSLYSLLKATTIIPIDMHSVMFLNLDLVFLSSNFNCDDDNPPSILELLSVLSLSLSLEMTCVSQPFCCFIYLYCTASYCSSFLGKSKRGELSIFPKTFIVLSHCLHMMPRQKIGPGGENTKVIRILLL